jgi:asparagine synthase (glutamine-hydrolysing)
LKVSGIVAAELSGGLDSSSVVCMADDLIQRGESEASRLETISHVYDESRSSDERHFIRFVEEKRSRTGHHIKESDYPLFAPIPEDDLFLPTPLHAFAETWRGLQDVMSRLRARVVLSGQGGDHVFMNESFFLPVLGDLLFGGRLGDFLSFLKEWCRVERTNYLRLLWNGVAWPSLPPALRNRFTLSELQPPLWMESSFVRQWDCRGRLIARPTARVLRRPSAERQYTLIFDAISLIAPSYYRERFCVEISYPFLDQELVEFLMAIPTDQKIRPGHSRSLHRRALKSLLPAQIAERQDKKGPDEAVHRGMIRHRHWINALAHDSELSRRGYVDPDAFVKAVRLACHGGDVQIQPLVRALTLEIWLRSYARWSRRSFCEPQAHLSVSSA